MDNPEPSQSAHRRFFIFGCMVEALLFLLGAGLNWLFGQGFLADLRWSWRQTAVGLVAAVPPLLLLFWTIRSDWAPLRDLRRFLDQVLLPLFGSWSIGELLVISLLAGFGEELFFRGAIQGGLSQLVGGIPGLVLASLIFACFHPMTWSYLILSALIGLYLGTLWWLTGNLLVPALVHACYDFLALLYLLKLRIKS